MDKVGWAKRIKQVNNFSNQVNTMIEIMSKNKCGIYKRDELEKIIPNLIEVVHFIDNNIFIKEKTGKGLKRLTKFNYGFDAIEIYDYFELVKKIDEYNENLEFIEKLGDYYETRKEASKGT